ncbi:MAG: 2Fe-2S iron-sulfur cluster binding domain-containing protein [Spirochaetales bacterium]|nr:MAG: 2Fe-2S iron-sulfur cluster binding domain-containing protein [Spirochaetales bacterium]
MPSATMNGKPVTVEPGTTILDAARAAGITIPTLCKMEHGTPLGACRVCVVEVESARTLVASCATPVTEGMVIQTRSARVRKARRTVVDLLLSEHEGNCQYCDRSVDCELKALAYEYNMEQPEYVGCRPEPHQDFSTPALVRDSAKCVKCRRCVTVCNDVQQVGALFPQFRGYSTVIAPAFASDLADVACVQCGQCAAVCPVGAICERTHIEGVWAALADPNTHVVVQTAPAVRAALGECFDMEPGTLVTGKMVTALRDLGFDAVFDTNFTADLTIMEEGTELLTRLTAALAPEKLNGHSVQTALPMFTSCSPGWINFAEYFLPDMLPNLSTCKSPQQMFGALAKTYYAETSGVDPAKMVVVSVMPCTAKKFEAQRSEMNGSGFRDVDFVLTTRELGRMIKSAGIDFVGLEDGIMDDPMGFSSGAADIFANTGGVMEAALRTAYELVTGRALPMPDLHVAPVAGLEGIKEAAVTITDPLPAWDFLNNVEVKVAVAHGLGNAAALVRAIQSGERSYHLVEVMTCPGGCIGGGGQPRTTTDAVRRARIDAIYREDEGKPVRTSHQNPHILKLYETYLKEPLGERSHHLLHTHYTARQL